MAGNRRGKYDVAPVVRASFLEALEIIKKEDGKTFPQIIAGWMREDPASVLNAVSKFTVREKQVDKNVTVTNLVDILTYGASDKSSKREDPAVEEKPTAVRH